MSTEKHTSEEFSLSTSRAITVASVLVMAIILGVIIYKNVATKLKTEAIYTEALEDRDRGDLVSAKRKLADIVRTNPSFKDAKDQLADVKQRINPGMGTSPPSEHGRISRENAVKLSNENAEGGSGAVTHPGDTGSRPKLKFPQNGADEPAKTTLPSAIEGFKLVSEKSTKDVVSRVYEPKDADSKVTTVTVAIKEHGDEQKASDALYSIRFKYKRGQQLCWVNGRMAYFGYDGQGLSILAWYEGGETVEIEAQGKDPKIGQIGVLMDIAREL
ncbi:MAG: hypothetical protein ACYC56_03305 [Candidatus Aquicultor sp.]